jgi:hypothetical protein
MHQLRLAPAAISYMMASMVALEEAIVATFAKANEPLITRNMRLLNRSCLYYRSL